MQQCNVPKIGISSAIEHYNSSKKVLLVKIRNEGSEDANANAFLCSLEGTEFTLEEETYCVESASANKKVITVHDCKNLGKCIF